MYIYIYIFYPYKLFIFEVGRPEKRLKIFSNTILAKRTVVLLSLSYFIIDLLPKRPIFVKHIYAFQICPVLCCFMRIFAWKFYTAIWVF